MRGKQPPFKELRMTCRQWMVLLSFVIITQTQNVWALKLESIPVQKNSHLLKHEVRQTLKVVTLNLAHGRGLALNQIFVTEKKTRDNLNSIANFFIDEKIDVAAVQEADAPSWWSGKFDHVELLARQGRYPRFVHSVHAKIKLGNYGTAVLSRLPVRNGFGLSFSPTPPTATKGFTLAELEWKTTGGTRLVDVISVHLDFSREKVRNKQLAAITSVLSKRKHPVILMGDLNSELIAENLLSDHNTSGFHTIEDDGGKYKTYKKKRLDWILLSSELIFLEYHVRPDKFSDHLAVIAEIGFSDQDNEI